MQMLERICRTLVSASGGAPDEVTDGIPAWQKVEYLARAVLDRMREPTEEMRDAAEKVEVDFRTHLGPMRGKTDGDHIWQAMIDAALE